VTGRVSGTVSIVGRPNAGKSTLLNRLIGQKLSIVSNKPQTTRHRVLGVKNVPSGQVVVLDTPGIHKPLHRMNRRMVDAALDTLREVDLVVLVVDTTERPGKGDRFVLDLLATKKLPAILALNKVDLINKPRLLPIIEHYARELPWRAIVPLSAMTGEGVDTLEAEILAALPEGEAVYPEEYLTDQTQRGMAAEIIREKVLHHTHDELPYATAVVIDQYEEPAVEGTLTRIFASILVDSESQKPIVVGKGGEMIKRIGTEARRDLEELTGGKVYLDLHVKVREAWRDDERLLDEMLGRKR
jgi:GTP-binding protein Era